MLDIYFERKVPQEMMRPCFRANIFMYGVLPLTRKHPAPFPLCDWKPLLFVNVTLVEHLQVRRTTAPDNIAVRWFSTLMTIL
jgi:hypothetical protein